MAQHTRGSAGGATEPTGGLLDALADALGGSEAQQVLCGRFLLERRLGQGAFGIVYRAEDLRDGGHVALKVLRRSEPSWLDHFKREFRVLQGMSHPNLVSLDELFCCDGEWFFTMELVDGVDFLRFVQSARASVGHDPMAEAASPGRLHGFHEMRLRDALRQLLDGVAVLHARHVVHRDIKPTNVLVTRAGRVAIIDFGLVLDAKHTGERAIVGTPAYMAPEQARSGEVGTPADLYSIGVMLHEALFGSRPASATPDETARTVPPASSRLEDMPPDLRELVVQLLHPDPRMRPSAAQACRLLVAPEAAPAVAAGSSEGGTFVGRGAEIVQLREAFDEMRAGAFGAVLISGESGIGKSFLVRHFMAELAAAHPELFVFEGTCFERESIPYKALDGVLDAVSRTLSQLSPDQRAVVLPADRAILARTFPALRRIPEFATAVADESTAESQVELRQRAFEALRALLARLAARTPTVIVIDDLQWADDDGLRALVAILRPPRAPKLLFLGLQRLAESGQISTFDRLRKDISARVRSMELRGLGPVETRRLAAAILGRDDSRAVDVERVALEADGHPLFVEELAGQVARGDDRSDASLNGLICSRAERLHPPARDALAFVVVASKPIAQEFIAAASGLAPAAFQQSLATLRAAKLVRTSGPRWADAVEPYHDRVREALVGNLAPVRRAELHERLALAFERAAHADAEVLAIHWKEAGNGERAATYALTSGEQAARAFAFDRAATWFEQALGLLPSSDPSRRSVHLKLGDALAFAGRGVLAAPHFMTAARDSERLEGLDLQRRAAEQLFRSGHMDLGIEASRMVLRAIGMPIPETRLRILALLAYYSALLLVRGYWFRVRAEAAVPREELFRIDTAYSMAAVYGFVEPLTGFVYQRRALLWALGGGEVERVVRALTVEAAYSSVRGRKVWRHTERLLERARGLAEQSPNTKAAVFVASMSGIAHYSNGIFRRAAIDFERALQLLRDASLGMTYERVGNRMFFIRTLAFLGEFARLRDVQHAGLQDALARGDMYAAVNMRVGFASLAWLSEDQPSVAGSELTEALRLWTTSAYHLEHYYGLLGRVWIELYLGNVARANDVASELMMRSRRALLWRVQTLRLHAQYVRGAAALALMERDPEQAPALVRVVLRDARSIEREQAAWMQPFATVLRAGAALHRKARQAAGELLDRAAFEFAAVDMKAYAAATRARAAELRADAASQGAKQGALDELRHLGVIAPERFAAMLLPGFSELGHCSTAPMEVELNA